MPPRVPRTLVAVDLGLRTGVAVLGDGAPTGDDGQALGAPRLRSYSSTHIGSRAALRRFAPGVLAGLPQLDAVVVEGDRAMGDIWERAATHHGARMIRVAPETWREVLLIPRERTPSATAKAAAAERARQVIEWSRTTGGAPLVPRPTGRILGDAADAIMVATWGAIRLGWFAPRDLPFPTPR